MISAPVRMLTPVQRPRSPPNAPEKNNLENLNGMFRPVPRACNKCIALGEVKKDKKVQQIEGSIQGEGGLF